MCHNKHRVCIFNTLNSQIQHWSVLELTWFAVLLSQLAHISANFPISRLTLKLYDTPLMLFYHQHTNTRAAWYTLVLIFAYKYNLMFVIYQGTIQLLYLMITCCLVTVLFRDENIGQHNIILLVIN